MCGRPLSGYNIGTDKKRKEHADSRQVMKRVCLVLPQPVARCKCGGNSRKSPLPEESVCTVCT